MKIFKTKRSKLIVKQLTIIRICHGNKTKRKGNPNTKTYQRFSIKKKIHLNYQRNSKAKKKNKFGLILIAKL